MAVYDEGFEECRVKIRVSGEADTLEVDAWKGEKALVILEQPGMEMPGGLPEDDPRNHNCDWMGCGQCHVMLRIDFD